MTRTPQIQTPLKTTAPSETDSVEREESASETESESEAEASSSPSGKTPTNKSARHARTAARHNPQLQNLQLELGKKAKWGKKTEGDDEPQKSAAQLRREAAANARWEARKAQSDQIWNSSNLTTADKVAMFVTLVTEGQDDQIDGQVEYLNELQQQAALKQAAYKRGEITKEELEAGPSIDTESLKLKRMTDKRTQSFDTGRQMIDKYNETARNAINSLGR